MPVQFGDVSECQAAGTPSFTLTSTDPRTLITSTHVQPADLSCAACPASGACVSSINITLGLVLTKCVTCATGHGGQGGLFYPIPQPVTVGVVYTAQIVLTVASPVTVAFSLSSTQGYEELLLLNEGVSNMVVTFTCVSHVHV